MDRRKFLTRALGLPLASTYRARSPAPVLAQAWPTRNITMIVAFPPGGQADLAARPVAAALEKILGKSVDRRQSLRRRRHDRQCRGGARRARRPHAADGALVDDVPAGGRAALRPQAVLRDRSARADRARAGRSGRAVRARSTRPDKTLADLVADAKKRPGQITFSSSGNYGAAHVPFEMFQQAAGIKLLHVPYRGGGPGAHRLHRQAGRHHRAGAGPDHIRMCRAAPPGCWRIGAPSAPPNIPRFRP